MTHAVFGVWVTVGRLRWRSELGVRRAVEVVDFDPTIGADGTLYAPVDLNHPYILANDGLAPSESNPQFHQQFVYAASMLTIQNFEKALGRQLLWAPRILGKDSPLHWVDPDCSPAKEDRHGQSPLDGCADADYGGLGSGPGRRDAQANHGDLANAQPSAELLGMSNRRRLTLTDS